MIFHSVNRKIIYLVVCRNIDRIGTLRLPLQAVLRTLRFHGNEKTANHIVAIHQNHIRSLAARNRVSRSVDPILIRLLYRNIRNSDLSISGYAILIQEVKERIQQLRCLIGITACYFGQGAGLFASGLFAWFRTLTMVTDRVAHIIDFVGIFSRFYIVKLQIGQPVLGTHAFEIKLVPLTVRGNLHRIAIIGVGHDNGRGQHLQSYPTSVVGVTSLVIAVISVGSVMRLVVRLVNQEVLVVVVPIQVRPTTRALLDVALICQSPEVSTCAGGINKNLEMYFSVAG